MKKLLSLLACAAIFIFTNTVYGQAKFIATNTGGTPFMVMNGGVYLVVENSNADALSPPGTDPVLRIVSEAENNLVKWHIGAGIATNTNYKVPFGNTSGESTTAMFRFGPAGTNIGTPGSDPYVLFATYGTPSTNLPLPSLVTHLTNFNTATATPGVQGTTANAQNTVDRFWFIEMIDWTGVAPIVKFTSPLSERSAPNSITAANVMVQRFNDGVGQWADWFSPSTSISAVNNTTGNQAVIPVGEFHKTWTLTSFDEPLSVELLSFDAECENERATIRWSTASEQNSDFFSVERLNDGQFWETIETVQAAGYSSSLIDYVVYDESAKNGMNYYKVTETDVNGVESEYGPISTSCGSNVFEIVNVINDFESNSPLNVVINSSTDKIATINIVDLTGKLVYSNANTTIQEGISTISIDKNNLAMGVYFIAVQTVDELLGRKVILN